MLIPKVQIFGTDLDERSVATARAGLYSEGIAEHVSPKRLKRFFDRVGNNYEVGKSLREMCLFSKHDLLQDPPFAKIDLVSCRNLLIYFGPELQVNVMALFTYSVKNNGFLLLGPTESMRGENSQFECINKEYKVFKNLNSYYLPKINFPLKFTGITKTDSVTSNSQEPNQFRQHNSFSQQVDNLILRKHIPAHVIIDKNFDVQFFSHNLEGLIIPSKGVPSNNLVQVIEPSLRVELRSLLSKASRESKPVKKERILFRDGEKHFHLTITIELLSEEEGLENFFLVVFDKVKVKKKTVETGNSLVTSGDVDSKEVEHLQAEIRSMKEQLRSTVEDLEHANEDLKSSNEELLSLNEEMQSGNEELQTSHEEMQSVNEELETVNMELSTKVVQLDAANSDLENLFRSTEIATIFLDNNLRIKRYTPRAKAIFNFIESDLNRPLTDLAFTFEGYDIEKELFEVVRLLVSKVQTVKMSKTNKWFKLQMHPYKTINNVIEGAIISLHEITELKEAEKELSDRLSQQVSVADFGFKALSNEMELSRLKKHAVRILKETLRVDFTKILELSDSGTSLLLVEGLGWNFNEGDEVRVGVQLESQAGYTLHSKYPVLVDDLLVEKRFQGPPLLTDHGVRSGISVTIKGQSGKAYGVLGVHSRTAHHLSEQDIQYVQSIANTLATAIERHDLIETKTRLAQIVNGSKDIIFSCNRDEIINSWNPAAEKAYDIKAKNVLGKSVSEFILGKSDVLGLEASIRKVLQGESSEEIKCEFFNGIGNRVVLSLNLTAIKSGRGKIEGVSFVGRDISEDLNNQKLLLNAKNAADEANELKSRFMGVLSHELRTPLSSILGYTNLLIKDENIAEKDKGEFLEKVIKNGNLLHSLVSDILDVSKIEQGKVDIKKSYFKLKDYISELVSALSALADKKGLSLEVNYLGKIPDKIKTDPLRLRQVIENLVSNGIKYTNKGRIEVRITVESQDDAGHALIIEVEDTGRGMTEDKMANLFSPFFRAEPGKGAPGVGLGLYLAKNLASQMGGRLSLVETTESKGSTFKLFVPVDVSSSDEETPKKENSFSEVISSTSLKDKTILLAEDSEDLRGLLTAYLELVGAKVDAFENGKLALAALKKNVYDLAILDLFMPEMDGKELVGEMKKLSLDIPAIVVTAHAMSNVRQECLDLGFKDYVSKPVTQEKLVETVLKNLVSLD